MSTDGMETPKKTPNKQNNPMYIATDEQTKTTAEIIKKNHKKPNSFVCLIFSVGNHLKLSSLIKILLN